ncbi:TIGR03619 family F420-dependent LLM class oxidoreductase [Actinosynnema mirum]|uniref:Luciferase-like monooxygenase n=1 Tax=Actinosynnema mirum (strain ATCC 29888 / DSM 43827 / JCM 3225 / NBRC 14064 / NCIMB 13271 / NRRL B-12336 / IMRU 3971 / 101) TaxID=446462 RepID=C6W812_ACTMD|nr:TIGR03619 family F420-dependent LLM class oxidoreductase [Actinosynnema mirum]ACU37033.1 Luciferase-like monooxygenase [Actinosynnema mirum DSM 43827]
MKIGFTLPQAGNVAWQAPQAARYARELEQLGADSLWVIDRLLSPVNPTLGHNGGEDFPAEFRAVLDPFVLLAVAATATERVLIGSNVLNAPWYPPALLARALTSLDVLSGGRLAPGFGVGWSPDEFEAVNVPMSERGARLDETLDVLDQLWTADPAEYRGKHWTLPATRAALKPTRRPPIYLAAFAPASMRRVATRADGWLPALVPPRTTDIETAVTKPWALIRAMAEDAGRDPDELDVILRIYPSVRSGTAVTEVVELIKRVEAESEVRHVLVDLMYLADDVDQMLDLAAGVLSSAHP